MQIKFHFEIPCTVHMYIYVCALEILLNFEGTQKGIKLHHYTDNDPQHSNLQLTRAYTCIIPLTTLTSTSLVSRQPIISRSEINTERFSSVSRKKVQKDERRSPESLRLRDKHTYYAYQRTYTSAQSKKLFCTLSYVHTVLSCSMQAKHNIPAYIDKH